MFGPCQDQVWPSFTSKHTRALQSSNLGQQGLRPLSMEFFSRGGPFHGHIWAMRGPCLAQLYFQTRLSQYGLRPMYSVSTY